MMTLRPNIVALALVLLACAHAARADRAGVEQALIAMQAAVLLGDADAYLAHVDSGDAVFRKEQENWAADLKKHKPIAFTLAIGDAAAGNDTAFEDHEARFELVMNWTMAGLSRDGSNLTRTASFPVRFTKDDAGGPWLYRGERWLALEATDESKTPGAAHRARAMYLAGFEEVAQLVVDVLPDVRDRVHEGFELSVDRVQEVKIYPTMRHLQASIYLSYSDPLSGWNEPGESIKLVVSPKTGKNRLKILLAHEYAHVATFEMGAKVTDAPWWVLEGVADLAAEALGGSTADRAVLAWAAKDELRPWGDLTDFRSVPGELHRFVYKQGQHMLAFISERFGRSARNTWLRAMAEGKSIEAASKGALGLTFERLDHEWRESVAQGVARNAAKDAKGEGGAGEATGVPGEVAPASSTPAPGSAETPAPKP